MRQRDAGIGRRANSRRDARYHLERDIRLRKRRDLFAASPEDEGVAALQPHHPLAALRPFDEQRVDIGLPVSRFSRSLAHVDQLRILRGVSQQPTVDEPVIDDHVGRFEIATPLDRQQFRVARPRAYEYDPPDGGIDAPCFFLICHG